MVQNPGESFVRRRNRLTLSLNIPFAILTDSFRFRTWRRPLPIIHFSPFALLNEVDVLEALPATCPLQVVLIYHHRKEQYTVHRPDGIYKLLKICSILFILYHYLPSRSRKILRAK